MKRLFFGLLVMIALAGAVSASTQIIYTTNETDGYTVFGVANSSFTEIRNNLTAGGANSTAEFSLARIATDTEPDTYFENNRGVLVFDGSAIPDNAIITAATVRLFPRTFYNALDGGAIGIVRFTLSPPISGGDYANYDFDRFSDDIAVSSFTTDGYFNWSLNPLGLSNISTNGTFGFGVLTNFDIDNTSPAWILPRNSRSGLGFNTSESVINAPFIEITYTLPDTTPPAGITGLSNVTTCNSINWSWTNPADADFSHTYILKDNVFDINASSTTTFRLWEDLTESTTYTFSSKTVDVTGTMNATWVNQSATTGTCTVAASSKIGVVRNNNTWLLDASGNGAYGAGDLSYVFGKAGDVYVTGDWNTDGKTEIGVVRNNNTWLLDASGNGAYGAGDLSYVFGKAGDVYVTGDWNNDGRTEIGVVRNGNTWILDVTGNGAFGAGDSTYTFGKAGDAYVTGDWNTDGKTEIGVVRNGNTWLLDASGNGAYGAGDLLYVFGKTGDAKITGKW